MGNKNNIFTVIFTDEMRGRALKKDIIAAAVLFMVTVVIKPDIKSFGVLLSGNVAVTLYLSILSMMSKIRDNRLKLWFSLPVDKKTFIIMYSITIFIKNNLFKVAPFISALLLTSLYRGSVNVLSFIRLLIMFFAEGYGSAALGIYVIFILYEKNIIKPSERVSNIRFSWLKREFITFFNDKSVMINHIAYSLFILIFLVNFILSSKGQLQTVLFMLGLISTCSTSGVLMSCEKPNIELIKSLPVSLKKLFVAKYVFSIIITLPVYIGAYIILILLKVNIDYISLLLFMSLSLLLTTFIKLFYDFKSPYFNWNHTRQIFQDKRRYKLWGMSMLISCIWIAYPYINAVIIALAQIIVTTVLAVLIDKFSMPW